MQKLSDTLRERGYVYQFSSETLEEITDGPKRTVYLGVDPTADSIHVGNFAGYMLLRQLRAAGHTVILLIGGGTGMIGDPKPDVERPLTPPEVVAERTKKLVAQARNLLGEDMEVVNNHDWLSELNLIGFLREIGKHFTVNNLIKKDAIATRLQSEEGITYTEFAYPLLQAYDFWHLYKTRGVDVQVSGSDQWGNIMAGVELVRRKEAKSVYALTTPLITDSSGKKFGKSEGNAIWLDAEKTTPFQFYQFWVNQVDEDIEKYLKIYTDVSLPDIATCMREHSEHRGARKAQRLLARSVTALVHGEAAATAAEKVSEALFGSVELAALSAQEREVLLREAPSCVVRRGEVLSDVLVRSGLAASKREARQFIDDGAITLNGGKVTDTNREILQEDFQNAPLALLQRGKRNVSVLTLA